METTVANLIERSGGVKPLADAVNVWPGTVRSWARKGIPDWHWPIVMELTGASLNEVFEANQQLRDFEPDPRPLGERKSKGTAA